MKTLPYTTITTAYTQPSVNSTVTVEVGSTSQVTSGQVMFVDNGGYYIASTIVDPTHLTILNLGTPDNTAPTTNVPVGSQVASVAPNDVTGTLPAANQAAQTVQGDLSGTTDSVTVIAIQGCSVDTTTPSDGDVLIWDAGAGKYVPGVLSSTTQMQKVDFTSSGTWICPTGVTCIQVMGWGGGGGGAGGSGTKGAGGGGALLGTALLTVVPGTTYTITVGAGGAAGNGGTQGSGNPASSTNGGNGDTTTISTGGVTLLSFAGASGGQRVPAAAPPHGEGGAPVTARLASVCNWATAINTSTTVIGIPSTGGYGGNTGATSYDGTAGIDAPVSLGPVCQGGAPGSGVASTAGGGGGGGAGPGGNGGAGGAAVSSGTGGNGGSASANSGAGGGCGGGTGSGGINTGSPGGNGGAGGSGFLSLAYVG